MIVPSLMDAKGAAQRVLAPCADYLCQRGVSPTRITALGLGGSLLVGAAAALLLALRPGAAALLLPVLWSPVRIAGNLLDGMVARRSGRVSPLGAAISDTADLLADAALYLPLALLDGAPAALLVVAVALGLCSEGAALAVAAAGRPRPYHGPLAKPDRAAAFGLVSLALCTGAPPGAWLQGAAAAICGLSALTLYRRLRRAA